MYDGIILVGFIVFFVAVIALIYLSCTRENNVKFIYALVGLIAAAIILGIVLVMSAGGSSTTASESDYKSQKDSGGKFGHGEQYDRDVYYAAEQFYG